MLSSAGYLYNDARDKDADAAREEVQATDRIWTPSITAAYAEMVLILGLGFGIAWSISPMFCLVAALANGDHAVLHLLLQAPRHPGRDVHLRRLPVACCGRRRRDRCGHQPVAAHMHRIPDPLHRLQQATVRARPDGGQRQRDTQEPMHYTPDLLVEFQAITTSGTVISYALYTVLGSPSPWLLLTLPYVLYGIFRYIFLVNNLDEGEEPADTLLRDMPLLATVVLYGVTVVGILFVTRIGV